MLEGEISQIKLIERLVELWREQFTGAIRFENDGIIKIVYFKSGDILSASTNDRSDSIDEILMRAGKVSREHVKQALAKRKENETLGDALLNLGFITRKELTWARRVQVVGVIRSIAAWTDGSFTIVADYLPKRDEGTLFPLPQVLVELIVTEQDRGRFEKALDGGNAVFTKTADFDDVWRRLGLNEDAEAIVVEIDGRKNATEVATASGRDTFNVYKLLDALATLGVLKRAGSAEAEPQFALDDFAAAGVADAADLWNDPVQPAAFELDETEALAQPTLEVPRMTIEPEPVPQPSAGEPALPILPAASAWDETDEMSFEEDDTPEPVVPAAPVMPGWSTPPREPVAAPAPAMAVLNDPPDEPVENWGFDEAQLETVRRAADPEPPRVPTKRRRPERRYGLIVAVLVIVMLAFAGLFAYRWWQEKQATAPRVVEQKPAPAPPPVQTASADTGTIVDAGTAGTTDTAPATGTTPVVATNTAPATTSTPATATTSTAAVPTPMRVTAEPAPAPVKVTPEPPPTVALPRVTAKTPAATPTGAPAAGRERYDAMAQEYAASNTARYTLQIQILCDASNLDKAMRSGGSNLWFVPQQLGSRSCYRVYWGRYATRDEAQRALAAVPAGLRDQNAAVKSLGK